MGMRIFLARAVEPVGRIAGELKFAGIKGSVLAGQDQAWRNAVRSQRVRQRGQFDRFGPGADDQSNVGETQPSP